MAMGRTIGSVALIILLLFGILINFLPTIRYYLVVNPRLKVDLFSNGTFLEYGVSGMFALVNISDALGRTTVVIDSCKIRLEPVNKSALKYDSRASIRIVFPFNGTTLSRELRSEGLVSIDSPLAKLLVLPAGVDTVNVSHMAVKLEKIPPNVVNFETLLNPTFYLKPIGYHGEKISEDNKTVVELGYWELGKGDLLLALFFYLETQAPIDSIAIQLLKMIFSGESDIMNLIEEHIDKLSNVILYMGTSDTNLRVRNDLLGRILFDFTVTYFPLNIALIAIGLIGLVLLHRRRI
ncbi:MAG: hypothetical protein QW348_05075 [Ignisphaera sp.]